MEYEVHLSVGRDWDDTFAGIGLYLTINKLDSVVYVTLLEMFRNKLYTTFIQT